MESVLLSYKVLSNADLDNGDNREGKIKACRLLSETVCGLSTDSSEVIEKVIGPSVSALLRIHSDSDMTLWSVAEECLWAILRAQLVAFPEKIMVELFKGVRSGEREKVKRVALARFSDGCQYLHPNRVRRFVCAMLPLLTEIVGKSSEPMMETFAAHARKLFEVFVYYMKEQETRDLIAEFGKTLEKVDLSASCKRACGDIVAVLCSLYPRAEWEYCVVLARKLVASKEPSVVNGGFVLLASLCRESGVMTEIPRHRDPRSPLVRFAPELIALAEKGISFTGESHVCQAACELAARIPSSLPFVSVLKLKQDSKSLRKSLREIVRTPKLGAALKAAALRGLAAWGGAKLGKMQIVPEDPLVKGNWLLTRAKKHQGEEAVVEAMGDESSVVARLAFEACGEILSYSPKEGLLRSVVYANPCEYWVVEKQRLIALKMAKWSEVYSMQLKAETLQTLTVALGNADHRVRGTAAETLAVTAPYLLTTINSKEGDSDSLVLEGAWKSVPTIIYKLLKNIRCSSSPNAFLGVHQAIAHLARHWSSPRRYLKKESSRLSAIFQRPLHSAWPSPLQSLFTVYAARAISELVCKVSLMCSLDHHLHVLQSCAAFAKGGGASRSSSWPAVLLHCLRVCRLYDDTVDPMDAGDDNEALNGGGPSYSALKARLTALQSSSLPKDFSSTPSELGTSHLDLLKVALKVIARLAKDISRPVATFGHFILYVCRVAMPLVPASCLNVCRAVAPLCFRPTTISTPSKTDTSPNTVMSPLQGTNPSTPTAHMNASGKAVPGLYVSSSLFYASGLGRPTTVAEDFPASLNFSAARVEFALKMRPLLPSFLEPLVLSFMEDYSNTNDVKVRCRTLDLIVTLVRCGVDYHRLDPKTALVSFIQQQILGKRSYLRDPMRSMPSMYTMLGVLVTDKGPVDANVLMQVAAPVFQSPYWRFNAKLVPSLKWLLRDLFVRRRMQLQKKDQKEDVFGDLRSHFVSCLVSKLPHEEVLEILEALLRSARPEKSLIEDIAVPVINAVVALAKCGKILLWRATQWNAWQMLLSRLIQAKLSSVATNAAAVVAAPPDIVLDPEDPDFAYFEICAPIGVFGGLMILQKLGVAQDRQALMEAYQEASEVAKIYVPDLYGVLKKEFESAGAKRSLFNSSGPSSASNSSTDLQSHLQNHDVVYIPPHLKSGEATPALSLKEELALLKVDTVSSSMDIPDDLYPLHEAFYRHAAKLLKCRSRLSRAELDQILLSAEALAVTDPERGPKTERALECLRGAILRPATTVMVTTSGQCPRNDVLKVTIKPLYKLDDEYGSINYNDERALLWRMFKVFDWNDEDDTLLGFVPMHCPIVFPPLSAAGSARAYGIICRLIRNDVTNAEALQWAQQLLLATKTRVMQNAIKALLDASNKQDQTSMDIHEKVDQMLRSLSPQIYCTDGPQLLLSEHLSPAQAVSLIVSHLIRVIRSDADLTPITHTCMKVFNHLPECSLHMYVISIKEATSNPILFHNILLFLLCCVLSRYKEEEYMRKAHILAHSLYKNHPEESLQQVTTLLLEQEESEDNVLLVKECLQQLKLEAEAQVIEKEEEKEEADEQFVLENSVKNSEEKEDDQDDEIDMEN